MNCQEEESALQKPKSRHCDSTQSTIRARMKPKWCQQQAKQLEDMKIWKAQQLGLLNHFRSNLKKEAQRNKQSLKKVSQLISSSNHFKQIDQIGYSPNIFQSISNFLSSSGILNKSTADWSSFIQTNLSFLYKDLIESKKKEKKLIICLSYCLQIIHDQINGKGFTAAQSLIINNFIKEIGFGIHLKLDQLLSSFKLLKSSNLDKSSENRTNVKQQSTIVIKELQDKVMRMEKEMHQLRGRNIQLTIKLQIAKERLNQQMSIAKQRLKVQMQIAKDRLKEQINSSREQREFLKLELLEAKERLKRQFQQARQRFKGQLQLTKDMLKGEIAKGKQEMKKNDEEKAFFRSMIQTLEVEAMRLEMAKQKLQEEINNAKEQSDNLKTEIENTKQMLQLEIEVVKAENNTLILQKKNLQNIQQNLCNQIYSFNHVIAALHQQVQFLKNVPPSNKMICYNDVAANNFFHGKILAEALDEKRFLIESIENHMDKRIIASEKLYDYHRDKNVSFHQFIDEQQGLVLILKTQYALVACFYSGLYNKELLMQEEALIISLDHSRVFRLNNFKNYPDKNPQDNRSIQGMIYSHQSLIFGNSQVRIPVNQLTIFSNFGINNCFFNSEGFKVGDLLNEGDNTEIVISSYQIHKAILDDKSFEGNFFEFQSSS